MEVVKLILGKLLMEVADDLGVVVMDGSWELLHGGTSGGALGCPGKGPACFPIPMSAHGAIGTRVCADACSM